MFLSARYWVRGDDSRCIHLWVGRCASSTEQPACDNSPGLQEHTKLAGITLRLAAGVNNPPYALVHDPTATKNCSNIHHEQMLREVYCSTSNVTPFFFFFGGVIYNLRHHKVAWRRSSLAVYWTRGYFWETKWGLQYIKTKLRLSVTWGKACEPGRERSHGNSHTSTRRRYNTQAPLQKYFMFMFICLLWWENSHFSPTWRQFKSEEMDVQDTMWNKQQDSYPISLNCKTQLSHTEDDWTLLPEWSNNSCSSI